MWCRGGDHGRVRLFTAIELPPRVRDALRAATSSLHTRHPGLRWSAEASWHLTLAFHGDVEENQVPELKRELAEAARRHRALELRLHGAGRFGRDILWARCVGDLDEARSLAASVQAAAARITGSGDRRFRAHVTLARARKRSSAHAVRDALAGLDGLCTPSWVAEDIVLLRSEPGAGADGGSRYTELGRYALE